MISQDHITPLTPMGTVLTSDGTTFQMRYFKLLGERVKARLFNSRGAELQIRAALLNRFTQLGKPIADYSGYTLNPSNDWG